MSANPSSSISGIKFSTQVSNNSFSPSLPPANAPLTARRSSRARRPMVLASAFGSESTVGVLSKNSFHSAAHASDSTETGFSPTCAPSRHNVASVPLLYTRFGRA